MLLLILMFITGYYVEPQEPTTLVYPPFGHCMGIYRAGTEQLAMLLGGLVRFDNPQGLACVKLDAWDGPGSSDDDELAVYGVNSGSGHIIYNADMYTLGLYGGSGSAPDQLDHPHGIAADPAGTVIVADTDNGRVMVLERNGSRLEPRDSLHAEFSQPWDVALDGSGGVWVTDRALGKVFFFDSVEDTLPSSFDVHDPTGIDAVRGDRWFYDDEDEFAVVIADGGNSLLRLENGQETARTEVSDFGGSVLNYPVIDFWGNVWVTDSLDCCVHKFTEQLDHLCSFGTRGHGDRQFWYPTGIAIWKRFGQVFIAEREGARYFWIGTDLIDPDIDVSPRGLTVTGTLTEDSRLDGFIYDSDGEEVCRFAEGRYSAGPMNIQWDGTTDRGVPVPGGDYSLRLEIQPVYSSRGYFEKTVTDDFQLEEPETPVVDGRTGV